MLALLVLSAGIASADQFDFSYTSIDTTITATGVITATYDSPGVYTITDVTGVRNGDAITFIPGNVEDIGADDILWYPANPTFLDETTVSGFAFSTTDGVFNPWLGNGTYNSTAGLYYEYTGNSGTYPGPEITFSAQAVPDGGMTLMLLGGALVGLATLRRKLRV